MRHPELQKQQQTQEPINFNVNYRSGIITFTMVKQFHANQRRMTQASGMTGGPWTYAYDGDGLRVEKSNASGGTLYWRAITGDTIAELDLTGSTTNTTYREYIFFAGRRIASRDSATPTPNVYFYYTDQVGSTTAITTGTGTVCYQASFTPYGEEHLAQTTTCSQNYKFTGYGTDSETGLDYAFARYYNSRLGRFMSGRSARWVISVDPQSLNRYAYVGNRPLNFMDPLGLEKCPAGMTEDPDGGCIIVVSTWFQPPPMPPSGYGGDPGGDNGGGNCSGAPCPPGTQGTGGGAANNGKSAADIGDAPRSFLMTTQWQLHFRQLQEER